METQSGAFSNGDSSSEGSAVEDKDQITQKNVTVEVQGVEAVVDQGNF